MRLHESPKLLPYQQLSMLTTENCVLKLIYLMLNITKAMEAASHEHINVVVNNRSNLIKNIAHFWIWHWQGMSLSSTYTAKHFLYLSTYAVSRSISFRSWEGYETFVFNKSLTKIFSLIIMVL